MGELNTVKLVCCTCGAEKDVVIDGRIAFGFELFNIAKESGFYPIIDFAWSRTLVFCDKECYEVQLTKNKRIRKRLIHKEKVKQDG